jgi:hypothetical protein
MKTKITHGFAFTFPFFFLLLSSGLFSAYSAVAQSVYDDFEGQKRVHYHEKGGVLDTAAKNPAPNSVNGSSKCALYVRNGSKKFDNIKMGISGTLSGVDKYATYLGVPPRFHMKVYTSAPAGTLIEILLGSRKGNNDYPAGTHSQYQAYTKTSNQWEDLEFLFSQIPQGSETAPAQIDQIVLLFNPNSSTSDTYYFDEIRGPELVAGSSENTTGMNPPQNTEAVNTTNPEATPTPTIGETQIKEAPKKNKKSKK